MAESVEVSVRSPRVRCWQHYATQSTCESTDYTVLEDEDSAAQSPESRMVKTETTATAIDPMWPKY